MEESKRQKQVARLIQKEMSAIFQKEGLTIVGGGMISISEVQVTPDLLEARIYLSLFKVAEEDKVLKQITEQTSDFRRQIGNQLRHQLRRIPHLLFFKDDTLERVFHMEALFKKIKEEHEGDA